MAPRHPRHISHAPSRWRRKNEVSTALSAGTRVTGAETRLQSEPGVTLSQPQEEWGAGGSLGGCAEPNNAAEGHGASSPC